LFGDVGVEKGQDALAVELHHVLRLTPQLQGGSWGHILLLLGRGLVLLPLTLALPLPLNPSTLGRRDIIIAIMRGGVRERGLCSMRLPPWACRC